MLRKCRKCGCEAHTEAELDEFVKDSIAKHGRSTICKKCKRSKNPDRHVTNRKRRGTFRNKNERRMYYSYKLMYKDIFALFTKQKGVCKICKCTPEDSRNNGHTYLAIDHCHTKGHVRGLLCMSCNTALGSVGDNIKILKEMIKFLEE